MLYLCRFKPLRDHLRGFLIAAWAGDKIAEFSFPEISFHFPLRPWFFFVSPAYAGKSRECARGLTRARNHPRVCGEKCFAISAALSEMGSPPRMRGKERILQARATKTRITPAYAGKSLHSTLVFCNRWDHPRVCGEKQHHVTVRAATLGSPPRMRGKGVVYVFVSEKFGITPAYAGKSTKSRSAIRWKWDHPRVCGEKRNRQRHRARP